MNYALVALFLKHGRKISVGVYLILAVGLVLVCYWGIKAVYTLHRVAAARQSIEKKTGVLAVTARDARDIATNPIQKKAAPESDVVQTMETEVETAAQEQGCTVQQFSAQPTSAPYQSHFGGPSGGYDMFDIRFSLTGNLGKILSMLQDLTDRSIPLEFGSLNLAPNGGDKSGLSVDANVELDAICKQGGAT